MASLLGIIKIIVILQLLIIAGFVFLSYLAKYYLAFRRKQQTTTVETITELLHNHFAKKELIPAGSFRYLIKHVDNLLLVIKNIEKTEPDSFYPPLKQQLRDEVLKPAARQLASSRHWLKRYYAADCYQYGFDEQDEQKIFHLINDNTLMVSLLASMVAIRFCNPVLINEMISTYAHGRHLQQSFLSQVAVIEKADLYPIVAQRLSIEEEPYTKIFCYRLLGKLPVAPMVKTVYHDLLFDLLDLRISVIDYLAHCQEEAKNELIYGLALDPAWEIRAAVARALSTVHTDKSYEILAALITDLEWWVRINSANSLYKLGGKGIAILKEQSPEKDKFAYETAKKVLLAGRNA